MLTKHVYDIQLKDRKNAGPIQWFFFCLLKGSRKVMIQSVLSSLFKEINFMKKDRKS